MSGAAASPKPVDFGLFFFASADAGAGDRYQLLLDAARFADARGFRFVSTPERHFHRFGGLFPNPAITSAALAVVTRNLQIRAGSLISPLHHTLRIVEDWSVIDNLSAGRVAISFGSGWNVNDFVFAPDLYSRRRELMLEQVDRIRELWRHGRLTGVNAGGVPVELQLYPRPVQRELPVWITSSGNPETFRGAGQIGANLLTHLENQDLDGLERKIDLYRKARAAHGHDPDEGRVTLMQHTLVAATSEEVAQKGETALRRYLDAAVELEATALASGGRLSSGRPVTAASLAEAAVRREVVDYASHKYRNHLSLVGSMAECRQRIHLLRAAGVDEVACLIDFVDDPDAVLAGLETLDRLREEFSAAARRAHADAAIARFLASPGLGSIEKPR